MKLGAVFTLISRRFLMQSVLVALVLSCGFRATAQTETSQPETKEAPAAVSAGSDVQSWPNFEKAFEAGVNSYQAKKYDEARLAFTSALQKEPTNVQTLTNLALVQYQLGQKAWAVALLRKAHNLSPDFSTPKAALDYIVPQLDVKEIPHEIQLWETIRSTFITPFTLTGFLALTGLCLFASGWLWLQYFGRRREALREDKVLPAFPSIPTIIAVIFIAVLVLTLMKVVDQGIPRGTVVNEKVTVYSAPNEQSVALFDLFGGLEVVLKSDNQDWVQVTYPGATTGWIPKSSLFQTSGRAAW
jgi:hypothetical protein